MNTIANTVRAFTISDFCKVHGIGRSLAYSEISAGRLRIRKAGRRTLILREDADAWLVSLPSGAKNHAA